MKREKLTPPKRKRRQAGEEEPEEAAEEPGKAGEEEPGEAAEEIGKADEEEESGEAAGEPGKADGEQGAAPASGSQDKPEKAFKPEKAHKPAKAKSSKVLAAPSKAAWNDMSYALKKLEKAGKHELPQAWKEAQGGGQQGKRHFYYNVFLLDPTQSKKAVHKESLERLTVKETKTMGWFTASQIGKMEGADPTQKDFDLLCQSACEGLKERPHEVKAWAKMGVKQYYYEKTGPQEEEKANESLTKAEQRVEMEDQHDFDKAEKALMADQSSHQVVLGKKSLKKAAESDAEEEDVEPEKAYKKAYQSLSKAVKTFSSSVDKLLVLKETLANKDAAEHGKQLTASLEELQSLQKQNEDLKGKWVSKLAALPSSLSPSAARDGKKKNNELGKLKEEVDQHQKTLSKALSPHKLWAKNAGLI